MKQIVIRIPFWKGKTLALHFRTWIATISSHKGVTNQTHDGYFIPMWDFAEDRKLEEITIALRRIQDEYDLSTIYIFQTYPLKSYRAVCFDKLIFTKSMGIICMTEHIDHQYLRFSWIRLRCVLRITKKKDTEERLVYTLQAFNDVPKSADHQAIFSKIYDGIPKPFPYPNFVKLIGSDYESFR